MAVTARQQFDPDYAVPPGWILEERLAVQGMSHAEFARRCGRSPKLISEIIAGKASLEPSTALQFEKVLGVSANIWLGVEASYKLHHAREAEARAAAATATWAKAFPIRELVKRGALQKPRSSADAVLELFKFFGVGSMDAWHTRYGRSNVNYRHSTGFKSDDHALATWRRLGEVMAEDQRCGDYRESTFKRATKQIRELTREPFHEALEQATALCNRAGVALALVQPLPKTALSGAAWWLSPRKAIILLSARQKSDDHLWFSFFHEAAHILLHGKKNVFIDEFKGENTELDEEANAWATNALMATQTRWRSPSGKQKQSPASPSGG